MLRRTFLSSRLVRMAAVVALALALPVALHPRTAFAVNDASCGEGESATYCCPEPGYLCVALPEPVEDHKFDTIPWPGCIGP